MSVIYSSIFSVIKNFPEQRDDIKRLLKNKDSFLGLCEDYRTCKEAFEYWSLCDSEEAAIRTGEYRSLLQELEAEIMNTAKRS